MAYNNQEIELKLPLTPLQYKQIKAKIPKIAKYIKSSHHIDDYYDLTGRSFLDVKYPYEWLTVRKRDSKVHLNYKHWYPENTKYTEYCDEFETEIKNPDSLEKMLLALGFEKIISVIKKREVYLYKNSLEIALDKVEELGYFIEIEAVKDFGSIKNARDQIFKFTESLGLKRRKTVPGGYASELLKLRNSVKMS